MACIAKLRFPIGVQGMRSSRWHQSTLVTEPQSGSGSKVCISLCIIHLFCCMSSHFPWRSILFSPSVSNRNFWLNYYFGTGHGYQQLPHSSVSHSCTIPKKPFRNNIANAELQIKAQREHACLSTSINNRGYEQVHTFLCWTTHLTVSSADTFLRPFARVAASGK